MPVSLEISGADVQESVPLGEGTTVLGRAPTSTILLNHPMVSRRHAEIRRNGSGVEIADMGSANGTKVNHREAEPKEWQPLHNGDVIEVGPFSLALKEDGDVGGATQLISSGTVLISPSAGYSLRVRLADGSTQSFPLSKQTYTLGRNADNDIVINDTSVSRYHARLEKRGDGYAIVDLQSTNGLTEAGEKVTDKQLAAGDTLAIGQTIQLEFRQANAPETEYKAAPIDVSSGPVVLGRGGDGEGAIDHPQVSKVHARILNENGRIVIEDADSETGTYVNGNRVQRQVLNEGDAVRLGGQSLQLVGGQLQLQDDESLTLEAVELRRVVGKGVTILQDVSLSIKAREFVAIVGPSGAGKSTLITALCGYQQANSGSVLMNGEELYSHLEAFRNDIGFVPQDDIIHRELNIMRAFDYAGRLRMPQDTTAAERTTRSKEVLDELALTAVAGTAVKQLSGGQRKRVSMGVELLTRPSFLFLDEATSGLDPGTETQMMKLFRHLADNGRIVVLVTHATKNVMICDKVAFMARGGYLAFYGPPEEALTYFGAKEFDEIYELLESKSGQEWGSMFRAYSQQGSAPQPQSQPAQKAPAKVLKAPGAHSPLSQFVTLTSRNLETLWCNRKDLMVLLGLGPFLGLLNFLIWSPKTFDQLKGDSSDAMNLFFMLTIITLLVGSLGSVREIVKEQAIYKRERMVCLQVLPYVFSKVFIGLVYALYSAFWLFLLQNVAVDFSFLTVAERFQLFVPVFLATFTGVMLGLLVSAISASEERSMMLIIGIIIPQFLLSGAALPIQNMGGIGPILTMPATTKWAFAALLTTAKVRAGACSLPDLSDCRIPGLLKAPSDAEKQSLFHTLDRYKDSFNVNVHEYWAAMAVLIVIVLFLVIIIQMRKDTV